MKYIQYNIYKQVHPLYSSVSTDGARMRFVNFLRDTISFFSVKFSFLVTFLGWRSLKCNTSGECASVCLCAQESISKL